LTPSPGRFRQISRTETMMRTIIAILAGTVVLMASGCNSKKDAGGGAAIRIAVIPKGTTHEFWKSIHAGALAAAKEGGAEILWKGPPKEDELADQQKVVEDFVTLKVDGIVLAPLNAQGLAPSVRD